MTDPLRDSFADVLTDLRESRGISQKRLATEAGFDHSYVSRLEKGTRRASRETAFALALALELDHDATARLLWAGGFTPPTQLDRLPIATLESAFITATARTHDLRPGDVRVFVTAAVNSLIAIKDAGPSVGARTGVNHAAD